MNWWMYVLGIIVCAIGGALDQNPTALRHATVLFVHTCGVILLLYGTGALKYE